MERVDGVGRGYLVQVEHGLVHVQRHQLCSFRTLVTWSEFLRKLGLAAESGILAAMLVA